MRRSDGIDKFLLPKILNRLRRISHGKFLIKADLLISKQMWSVFSFGPKKSMGASRLRQ